MKKIFLFVLTMILISFAAEAQNRTVEKSIFGAQIGFLGLDFYNEARLTDKIALRSDINLSAMLWGGIYSGNGFVIFPSLALHPKYYYNIDKRADKGKNTKNNSANYLGLQLLFVPDLFVISNYSDVSVYNQLQIYATYGIRRNFGNKFNYEFSTGLGYVTTIGYAYNDSALVIPLWLKIGYDF